MQSLKKSTPPPQRASQIDVLMKLRIVIRAAHRHSAWTEKQCGVTGAQLWVIQELHEAGQLRVGEVAARLSIHQTTASNLIDALAKRELVVKQRDSGDQRVVNLALSTRGKAIFASAPKPARGLLPEALMQLDATALDNLNAGLQSLLSVIDSVDESHGLQPLPFTM